jgi:hypothetical protein
MLKKKNKLLFLYISNVIIIYFWKYFINMILINNNH